MKHHVRAGLAALFAVSFVGCGSDEPALKTEMSGADKTAYEAKNRGNLEGQKQASPTGGGQQSQEYKNAMSGGGPGRKPK